MVCKAYVFIRGEVIIKHHKSRPKNQCMTDKLVWKTHIHSKQGIQPNNLYIQWNHKI